MGPQDPFVGDMPSSRARAYLAEAHDGLDAAWTEHDSEIERFEAFRALDDELHGWPLAPIHPARCSEAPRQTHHAPAPVAQAVLHAVSRAARISRPYPIAVPMPSKSMPDTPASRAENPVRRGV